MYGNWINPLGKKAGKQLGEDGQIYRNLGSQESCTLGRIEQKAFYLKQQKSFLFAQQKHSSTYRPRHLAGVRGSFAKVQ